MKKRIAVILTGLALLIGTYLISVYLTEQSLKSQEFSVQTLVQQADSVSIKWASRIPKEIKTSKDSTDAGIAQLNSIYWKGVADGFRTIYDQNVRVKK